MYTIHYKKSPVRARSVLTWGRPQNPTDPRVSGLILLVGDSTCIVINIIIMERPTSPKCATCRTLHPTEKSETNVFMNQSYLLALHCANLLVEA